MRMMKGLPHSPVGFLLVCVYVYLQIHVHMGFHLKKNSNDFEKLDGKIANSVLFVELPFYKITRCLISVQLYGTKRRPCGGKIPIKRDSSKIRIRKFYSRRLRHFLLQHTRSYLQLIKSILIWCDEHYYFSIAHSIKRRFTLGYKSAINTRALTPLTF